MIKEKNINIVFVNFDIGFNLGYIADYLVKQFPHVVLYKVYFRDLIHEGASEITIHGKGEEWVLENPFGSNRLFQQSILLYVTVLVGMIKVKIFGGFQKAILVTPNPYFLFFGFLIGWRTIYVVGDRVRVSGKTRWTKGLTRITKFMTEMGVGRADFVWFISESLKDHFSKLRKKNFLIQTMAIEPEYVKLTRQKGKKKILYIGAFSIEKGIDIVMNLAKLMPKRVFILIGDTGSDNRTMPQNVFSYPVIIDEEKIKEILGNGKYIAVAPYHMREKENYLGDPTKIKQYLHYGFPVVTTPGIEFSKEIKRFRAGEVVGDNSREFGRAIEKIDTNYQAYRDGVEILVNEFKPEKVYNSVFNRVLETLYAKN